MFVWSLCFSTLYFSIFSLFSFSYHHWAICFMLYAISYAMPHKATYLHNSSMTVNWIKFIFDFNYFHNVLWRMFLFFYFFFLFSFACTSSFILAAVFSLSFDPNINNNSLFAYFVPFDSIPFFKRIFYNVSIGLCLRLDFDSIR